MLITSNFRAGFIGTAAIAVVTLSVASADAAPRRPSDDTLVLATVPANESAIGSDLRIAELQLAHNPHDLGAAVRVARLAIELGRAWSDPRRYGQAQAALAPWWSSPSPPEEVRLLRAVVRQALHDFQGALSDLDEILARSPGNAQARLSRALVRLVIGDFRGAAQDCRSIPLNIGPLPAAICSARVEALTGQGKEAYVRLAGALDVDKRSGEAMRAFALPAP